MFKLSLHFFHWGAWSHLESSACQLLTHPWRFLFSTQPACSFTNPHCSSKSFLGFHFPDSTPVCCYSALEMFLSFISGACKVEMEAYKTQGCICGPSFLGTAYYPFQTDHSPWWTCPKLEVSSLTWGREYGPLTMIFSILIFENKTSWEVSFAAPIKLINWSQRRWSYADTGMQQRWQI